MFILSQLYRRLVAAAGVAGQIVVEVQVSFVLLEEHVARGVEGFRVGEISSLRHCNGDNLLVQDLVLVLEDIVYMYRYSCHPLQRFYM